MSRDPVSILAYSSGHRPSHWRPWALALGCGAVAGFLLGFAITGPPGYVDVPVIAVSTLVGTLAAAAAGIIIGLISAATARSHPLQVTLAASFVAAASSAAMIVLRQWHRGRWPVGTINGRMLVAAAALLIVISAAALAAAGLVMIARRRASS